MNKIDNVFSPDVVEDFQSKNPFIKLNDIVYQCVEDAILTLQLSPGSKINASEIAKALGVSITPVNNAIHKLMTNGLITQRPKSTGYYVFDVDDETVTDIFDFRKCIEGYAAYECARVAPIVDIGHLRALAEDYQMVWVDYASGSVSIDNVARRQRADYEFHKLIVDSTGNELIIEAYSKLQPKITYALLRTLSYWDRVDNMVFRRQLSGQHLNIVNAVSMGVPDVARQVAEYHVSFAAERFMIYKRYL